MLYACLQDGNGGGGQDAGTLEKWAAGLVAEVIRDLENISERDCDSGCHLVVLLPGRRGPKTVW